MVDKSMVLPFSPSHSNAVFCPQTAYASNFNGEALFPRPFRKGIGTPFCSQKPLRAPVRGSEGHCTVFFI